MPRTLLTDELWSKLFAILLEFNLYDKPNLRSTIEAILYRMRTGCPWRNIPATFGKFPTIYSCFNRWSKKGIFQEILKRLSAEADREWLMMDGSYIRAHQHSAGAAACSGEDDHAIGISRGGTTSKMHLMVNDVSDAPELIAAVDWGERKLSARTRATIRTNCAHKLRKKAAKPIFPTNAIGRRRTKTWTGIFIKSDIWLRILLRA